MDKINKEAWEKLSIAQNKVKSCVSKYIHPAQNKLKEMWTKRKKKHFTRNRKKIPSGLKT